MSLVFPNYLPGVMFTQKKSPTFKSGVHTAITGKESRIAYRAFPMYQWELAYELLRDYADGQTNLVPYSQDFTQWSATHGSSSTCYQPLIVANQATDPLYGTLTADQLILNKGAGGTTNDLSYVYLTPASLDLAAGTYTGSVWLRTLDGSTVTVNFGLFVSGGGVNITVTPNWQRFSVTGTAAAAATLGIGFVLQGTTGSSNYANLAAWGAQLEPASSPGLYLPTNGAAVVAGDLKTLFGFYNSMLGQQGSFLYQDPDYNTVDDQQFGTGNGSTLSFQLTATYMPAPGWPAPYGLAGLPELIQNTNGPPQISIVRYGDEELLSSNSRTNLAIQSNTMSTSWSPSGVTATAGAAFAPDGSGNGIAINEGTTTAVHALEMTSSIAGDTLTAGGYYTASVFLRYDTMPNVEVIFDDGSSNGIVANFNVQTGTLAGITTFGTAYPVSATITGPFTNNWYRCTVSGVLPAATTAWRIGIACANSATPTWYPSYTGTSRIVYAWGAQLEAGVLPTALIPTTTTSLSTTDYSVTPTNQVNFNAAPANGALLIWSGSFYYRVRFADDNLDFDEILYQFWELKKLDLQQVKL